MSTRQILIRLKRRERQHVICSGELERPCAGLRHRPRHASTSSPDVECELAHGNCPREYHDILCANSGMVRIATHMMQYVAASAKRQQANHDRPLDSGL